MQFSRLMVTGVRSLKSARLDELTRINVISGANGSGKTSILEAIHCLSVARSFRSTKISPIISDGERQCDVFGEWLAGHGAPIKIGVQRSGSDKAKIRVNGESLSSVHELASLVPLVVINSESFRLLEGGPAQRRQYLDWTVFHVEHRFFKSWRSYQQALKQRNALLRSSASEPEKRNLVRSWDRDLVQFGDEITRYRRELFGLLGEWFDKSLSNMSDLNDIALSFHPGWNDEQHSLEECLLDNFKRDLSVGYTRQGPHRCDLRVKYREKVASELLSRGQIKMVVAALKLAQGRLLKQRCDRDALFLIDDLPSELDDNHRELLCRELKSLGSQVFITCVEADEITPHWEKMGVDDLSVFHVEHGTVTRANVLESSEQSSYKVGT